MSVGIKTGRKFLEGIFFYVLQSPLSVSFLISTLQESCTFEVIFWYFIFSGLRFLALFISILPSLFLLMIEVSSISPLFHPFEKGEMWQLILFARAKSVYAGAVFSD